MVPGTMKAVKPAGKLPAGARRVARPTTSRRLAGHEASLLSPVEVTTDQQLEELVVDDDHVRHEADLGQPDVRKIRGRRRPIQPVFILSENDRTTARATSPPEEGHLASSASSTDGCSFMARSRLGRLQQGSKGGSRSSELSTESLVDTVGR